jgi:hypothetical protein
LSQQVELAQTGLQWRPRTVLTSGRRRGRQVCASYSAGAGDKVGVAARGWRMQCRSGACGGLASCDREFEVFVSFHSTPVQAGVTLDGNAKFGNKKLKGRGNVCVKVASFYHSLVAWVDGQPSTGRAGRRAELCRGTRMMLFQELSVPIASFRVRGQLACRNWQAEVRCQETRNRSQSQLPVLRRGQALASSSSSSPSLREKKILGSLGALT